MFYTHARSFMHRVEGFHPARILYRYAEIWDKRWLRRHAHRLPPDQTAMDHLPPTARMDSHRSFSGLPLPRRGGGNPETYAPDSARFTIRCKFGFSTSRHLSRPSVLHIGAPNWLGMRPGLASIRPGCATGVATPGSRGTLFPTMAAGYIRARSDPCPGPDGLPYRPHSTFELST